MPDVAAESDVAAAHDPTPSAADKASGHRYLVADAIDGQPRTGLANGVDRKRATREGETASAAATDAQILSRREVILESGPPTTVPSPGAPLDPSRPRTFQRLRSETASKDQLQDRFVTAQGGLFFLLNFLKREDVQVRIQQESTEDALASGWGWLYRLGEELALDASDPVVGFLALQMGLDNPEELERLPPLPARDHLLTLARQLYGRFGLWQPDLLRLNARVQYTPSHVDLYTSLQNVRMPVRLAGLDLDPGWLPWLGRVVTFFYE